MKLLLEIKKSEVPKLVGRLLDAAELASRGKTFAFVEITPQAIIEVAVAGWNPVLNVATRTGYYELAHVSPSGNGDVEIHLRNCFSWPLAEIVKRAIKTSPRTIAGRVTCVYEVV